VRVARSSCVVWRSRREEWDWSLIGNGCEEGSMIDPCATIYLL